MSKVIPASALAALIKDALRQEPLLARSRDGRKKSPSPWKRDLLAPAKSTLVHASGSGDWATKGTQHFAHDGMIARWIGGHCGLSPNINTVVTKQTGEIVMDGVSTVKLPGWPMKKV
jgi:propionate CoA-transferase